MTAGKRPDFLGFAFAAFLVGCMLTGFYTMIIYLLGLYDGWRLIVCGS